jgi:hypothetical protein
MDVYHSNSISQGMKQECDRGDCPLTAGSGVDPANFDNKLPDTNKAAESAEGQAATAYPGLV